MSYNENSLLLLNILHWQTEIEKSSRDDSRNQWIKCALVNSII